MALLGNTLEAIASEKAGIIKKRIPVVVGEYHSETWKVFSSKAIEMESPISLAEENWEINSSSYINHSLELTIIDKRNSNRFKFTPDLNGSYQSKNLVTVLEAVHQLRNLGWTLPEVKLIQGISNCVANTGLWGRWQLLAQEPTIIADVGHNVDGITQVLEQLKLMKFDRLHWILGMVKDKDVESVLEMLPQNAAYYFTQAQIPRALEADELSKLAAIKGLSGLVCPTVNKAIDAARKQATKQDLILICGSVFMVGEALEILMPPIS
jgi:dihydrofolate synthase/folylpolyglutamate synthase